jgi:hypothetical protein
MLDNAVLIASLSPPLDEVLVEALLREFVAIERRFVLGDWEPATLDGGQFCEIAARILYHVDSGNLNRTNSVDTCLQYVEDDKNSNSHAFPQRRAALHLCKVIRTVYKFRSQRGAVHIDPDYTANEIDSMLVLSMVRWVMAEVLRVFWSGSTAAVAQAIREIARYEVPAILILDDRRLVLRTDCTVEEEILLLLHNAGESGLGRADIGRAVPKSAPAVTNSLRRLCSPSCRQVVKRKDASYLLTPRGARRVREELADKLRLA